MGSFVVWSFCVYLPGGVRRTIRGAPRKGGIDGAVREISRNRRRSVVDLSRRGIPCVVDGCDYPSKASSACTSTIESTMPKLVKV